MAEEPSTLKSFSWANHNLRLNVLRATNLLMPADAYLSYRGVVS